MLSRCKGIRPSGKAAGRPAIQYIGNELHGKTLGILGLAGSGYGTYWIKGFNMKRSSTTIQYAMKGGEEIPATKAS
jgi:hypothetical protein